MLWVIVYKVQYMLSKKIYSVGKWVTAQYNTTQTTSSSQTLSGYGFGGLELWARNTLEYHTTSTLVINWAKHTVYWEDQLNRSSLLWGGLESKDGFVLLLRFAVCLKRQLCY